MKRKAIICDIDNCLINISKIENEVLDESIDPFEFFESKANNPDWVNKTSNLFKLINLYYDDDYEIILLTARSKRLQRETYKFLTSGLCRLPKEIIMICRGIDEEGIPDHILKESKLLKLLEDFYIELAIDDNQNNCDMFRRNGIYTLKVIN